LGEEAARKMNSIHELGEQIGTKLAKAEEMGAQGLVDDSIKLLEEVEQSRRKKQEAEHEFRSTMPASTYQQQKLRVCEVCSAYLGIHDNDRRLADHFGGKLHLGFIQIREKLQDLKKRVNDVKEKRELERKQRKSPSLTRTPPMRNSDRGDYRMDRGGGSGYMRGSNNNDYQMHNTNERANKQRTHTRSRSRSKKLSSRDKRRSRSRSGHSSSKRSKHSKSHHRSSRSRSRQRRHKRSRSRSGSSSRRRRSSKSSSHSKHRHHHHHKHRHSSSKNNNYSSPPTSSNGEKKRVKSEDDDGETTTTIASGDPTKVEAIADDDEDTTRILEKIQRSMKQDDDSDVAMA